MKKQEITEMKQQLESLIGKPINYITRAANMICVGFGNTVVIEKPYRTKENTFEMRKREAAEYALHIQCAFRLYLGDRIVAATSDIYQPTEKALEDPMFVWDNFQYDEKGNNQFDWIVEHRIAPYYSEFVVKGVTVNKFGDVKISFHNDYVLELMVDSSLDSECWRFFSPGDEDSHLVILGTGIEEA